MVSRSPLPRPATIAFVLSVFAGIASAQNVRWGQLVPATSPYGRLQHAMAYDAARQRTVVYGGYNGGAGISDLWEWDGTTWLQRVGANGPAIRRWHAMAYDAARQRVVLFGGQSDGGTYPVDTWTWDGSVWTQHVTPSPGTRWKHAMAYDATRQRIVLFGGAIPGIGGSIWNDETWEWDGTTWLQRQPATSPPGRQQHAMAYDEVRQRIVVFSGATSGWVYDTQTWLWDGTNWTQASPATSPQGRGEFAMAFDATRQTVVLFGGFDPAWGNLRDTWEWNGTNWIQSTPVVRPSARSSHTMVYHAASQAVLLFGGGGALADTWSTYLPASALAYGTGCGSPLMGFVPDPSGLPRIGQTGRADIVNAPPASFLGVAAGWSNTTGFGGAPLPVLLDPYGMPGCALLQSTEVIGLGVIVAGAPNSSFQMAIPNNTWLLGKRLYLQSFALVPSAVPVVSNGIAWLFGNV